MKTGAQRGYMLSPRFLQTSRGIALRLKEQTDSRDHRLTSICALSFNFVTWNLSVGTDPHSVHGFSVFRWLTIMLQ